MEAEEILQKFEACADTIERASAAGNESETGKRYLHAGRNHAKDIRNLCGKIRIDIKAEKVEV